MNETHTSIDSKEIAIVLLLEELIVRDPSPAKECFRSRCRSLMLSEQKRGVKLREPLFRPQENVTAHSKLRFTVHAA